MNKQQFLKKLDQAWAELQSSYAGLSAAQLAEPGVIGDWSVKDLLAHVSAWEAEALKYLPVLLAGGTPPRYSTQYGSIDAFNAQVVHQTRGLSPAALQRQQAETHARLLDYLRGVPEEPFTRETRFRRRLRLETYGHYALHSKMIRDWRKRVGD